MAQKRNVESENSATFRAIPKSQDSPAFWGKAFAFRRIYRSWLAPIGSSQTPIGFFEVFNPIEYMRSVCHVVMRRTNKLHRHGRFESLIYDPSPTIFSYESSTPKLLPRGYFKIHMYDKLVESQFYWRWYRFMHLMSDYPLNFHPTQVKIGTPETNDPPSKHYSDYVHDVYNIFQKLI